MSLLKSPGRIISDTLESDEFQGNSINLGNQKPRKMLISLGIFVIGVLFVLLVWQLVADYYNANLMRSLKFPNPADSFDMLIYLLDETHLILRYSLADHVLASMGRWIKGFGIAIVIGMVLGILMGMNDTFYKFASVPVNILQMIPGLAWFPVTILLFGFGDNSAIFIIAITVISPIAFNISAGLRRVPEVNLRVAKMSGKSRWDILLEVLLPFAILDIIGGFRIGMANSWRMLIAAEMVVGVAVGLGYTINQTANLANYPAAFAGIIVICIVGLVIDKLIFANIESIARNKMGLEGSN